MIYFVHIENIQLEGLALTLKEIFPDLDSKLILKIVGETDDPAVAFAKADEANVQREFGGTQMNDCEPFMQVKTKRP
jgi:hypothetical protein